MEEVLLFYFNAFSSREPVPTSLENALGHSEGLDTFQFHQADASRHNFNQSVSFKLGEGAADRFDGEAQEIRDVLAAHRQGHRVCRTPGPSQSVAPADQETRDLFFRRGAPEQN